MKPIQQFFEKYITKEPLFVNKAVLQSTYEPTVLLHREKEIMALANIIAPALKLEKPSNVFIYGKTGTGKTLTTTHVTKQLLQVAKNKDIPLKILYVNCKLKNVADTEYRLIAHLAREFGKAIPPTGLPTEEIYKIFFSAIDNQKQVIILVLDEIDYLVKKIGDGILYNFTRINSELSTATLTLVGISNDLLFIEHVDPRIKSSLSEEELVFAPYNAFQLQDILRERAKKAFKEGVLETGVIEKCAAYAARDHGDARRALDLLRVAGEIAERQDSRTITIAHLDSAEEKIEKDKAIDIIESQPRQYLAVLYTILHLLATRKEKLFTGDVYDYYKDTLCHKLHLRPLTQRRVSDVVAELDMLGLINAKVVSKGRYGRTKEITHAMTPQTALRAKKLITEKLNL
ncbi:MAG: orc1/cdc6 family replication initiation protein [Candidatus Woesearchaeota archaeon]